MKYSVGSIVSCVGKVFTFQDIVTKIHSNHIFKAGAWVEQDGENDQDQVRVTPAQIAATAREMLRE